MSVFVGRKATVGIIRFLKKNSQKEKNSLVENHASSVGVHSSSIELKIATIGRETQSLELINLSPFTSKTKMDEGLNIFS